MADTFKSVMMKFAGFGAVMHPVLNKEVKLCAIKVRDTATKKFGHYQGASGGYPAWEQLKESTIKAKTKFGGGEDPLIGHFSGKKKKAPWPAPLRTTIEMHVDGLVATVGTKDPLGKYHEYGAVGAGKSHNVTIPPRPFLRPALFEETDFIRERLAAALGVTIKKM